MTLKFSKCGADEAHANALGVSLALGHWFEWDRQEQVKQLRLSVGLWWGMMQWQIWRSK